MDDLRATEAVEHLLRDRLATVTALGDAAARVAAVERELHEAQQQARTAAAAALEAGWTVAELRHLGLGPSVARSSTRAPRRRNRKPNS